MEYFEMFGIPVRLKVDTSSLSDRFFELSRKFHPDYYANADEAARKEALEQSAKLNKAMQTLQDMDETIKYVLQQKGLMMEEEKFDLPTDFLMEVLEINEQLMDEEDNATRAKQEPILEKLQSEIYEPVQEIVENYQEGITTQKELLQVKEYYYKKKYLDRIWKHLKH